MAQQTIVELIDDLDGASEAGEPWASLGTRRAERSIVGRERTGEQGMRRTLAMVVVAVSVSLAGCTSMTSPNTTSSSTGNATSPSASGTPTSGGDLRSGYVLYDVRGNDGSSADIT